MCPLQERRIHRDTDNSFGMNICWKYFLKERSDEQLMIANVDSPLSGHIVIKVLKRNPPFALMTPSGITSVMQGHAF